MTLPRAARVLGGGLGIVAGVMTVAAVVAAAVVALGLPAESRADDPPPVIVPKPTELVVAVTLANPALQAGAVKDGRVILARGLEVDIARQLAHRLGIPRVRFVYVRLASRLLATTAPPWHLVIASVPSTADSSVADLSSPYLPADQAVVLRRGLPATTTLAQLRLKIVCAVRGSAGAKAAATVVSPATRPILSSTGSRLLQLVQTGVCDAALVDALNVGAFVAGKGMLLGPVRGRVAGEGGYVVAVTKGGPIAVDEVDRALRRMQADGTMHRLSRTWLGIDPARLTLLG